MAIAWLLYKKSPLPTDSGQDRARFAASAPASDRSRAEVPTSQPRAIRPIESYPDVVAAFYPDFPTTRPLTNSLELRESAKFVFDLPVYLDALGQTWISTPRGAPIRDALKGTSRQSTHVTRERVRFVHRYSDPDGVWRPSVVIDRTDGAGFELVTATGRRSIGGRSDYQWSRAFSWNADFVVPTSRGVSIFRPEQLPTEIHRELIPQNRSGSTTAAAVPDHPIQVLLDYRGLIAWAPPTPGAEGGDGIHRFVDGAWASLEPARGWPKKVLHVIPLLDGGLLVLSPAADHAAALSLHQLDPTAEADPKPIEDLVNGLSDPDPDRRDDAHKQLSRFGTRSWPILERLLPDQAPEAAERIRQLLAAKLEPKLGRMTLLPGKTTVFSRLGDGGVILRAEGGVSIPRPGKPDVEPAIVAPAWICVRPGRPIEPLSPWLLVDMRPDTRIDAWGDEWIVSDGVKGPQRLLGNHLAPILPKRFKSFNRLVGIDRDGRWLLRENIEDDRTLVVDPTLPDATPTLPVWQNPAANAEAVGWTDAGWPVMKRGGAYVLDERGWRPLDPKIESFHTELHAAVPSTLPMTTLPSSGPATGPSTFPSTRDTPLLVDAEGNRYHDGSESLRVISKDGREIVWPLPPTATGRGDVWLLKSDDRLFLFNQPGRVLRIRATLESSEPFKLEATFVRGIPLAEQCTRIWKDPAGRIVMAYAGNQLAILFPSGRIPTEIQKLMPASELERESEKDKE